MKKRIRDILLGIANVQHRNVVLSVGDEHATLLLLDEVHVVQVNAFHGRKYCGECGVGHHVIWRAQNNVVTFRNGLKGAHDALFDAAIRVVSFAGEKVQEERVERVILGRLVVSGQPLLPFARCHAINIRIVVEAGVSQYFAIVLVLKRSG